MLRTNSSNLLFGHHFRSASCAPCVSVCQNTLACVDIRRHTFSIRQHTSAYVSIRPLGTTSEAASAIKALLRRYLGAIKALLRLS